LETIPSDYHSDIRDVFSKNRLMFYFFTFVFAARE
jgi:hypothetical protein